MRTRPTRLITFATFAALGGCNIELQGGSSGQVPRSPPQPAGSSATPAPTAAIGSEKPDSNQGLHCSLSGRDVFVVLTIQEGRTVGPGTWGRPKTQESGSIHPGLAIPDGQWVVLKVNGDDVAKNTTVRLRLTGTTFEVDGEPASATCDVDQL